MIDLLNLHELESVSCEIDDSGRISVEAKIIVPPLASCPKCGGALYRHGKRSVTYADTPRERLPVRIKIDRPRHRCRECNATIVQELDCIDENHRATKRLVDSLKDDCLKNTFTSLARETGLAVNSIKNIANDHIEELERTVKYDTPVIMGIDEVNLAGDYRGIITNLSTRSIFYVLEFRTQEILKQFFETLPDREKVEWVCTDMWRPFKKSFQPYFPNAKLVIDKFHVVRMANDALDAERKRYQAALDKNSRVLVKKHLRWMTLKRPSSLSNEEKEALALLKETVPSLACAYELKECFFNIYDAESKEEAISTFREWSNSLPTKEYPEFHKLVKTVNNHFEDIFAYWDAPFRITNAYTESLNGLAKMANRLGRGYSFEIIRARILYGDLTGRKRPSSTNGKQNVTKYGPMLTAI